MLTRSPMTERDRINPVVTIAVACVATVMLMLDISVINTALSQIAHGLGTGLSGLQWVVDAYTIPLAATVLSAGAIADRFGRRKLFLLGLATFTASSALCGAVSGIEMLVAARAVQGLGASMMFATALALISQVTPDPTSRTKALAAYGAAIGASFALGPFIGGSLTALFGWRAIFLVNVPIGLTVLWITYRRVAESRDPTPRRVDVPGQITLIGGLFLLVLALLRGNVDGWGSAGVIAALAGAALVLVGAGLAGMLIVGVGSSWTALLPGLLVTSIGTGLFNPTGSELALRALPFHQSGLAAGANDTFRQTGVAVGIAALGTLVPAGAALGGNPQAYVDGLHHALIVSAAIALTGAVATALLLIPTRSRAEAEAVAETAR